MVTVQEAYYQVEKLPKRNVLVTCLDTDDEWVFQFSLDKLDNDDWIDGGVLDVVNKKTGEVTQRDTTPATVRKHQYKRVSEVDIRQFEKGKHRRFNKLEKFLMNFNL